LFLSASCFAEQLIVKWAFRCNRFCNVTRLEEAITICILEQTGGMQ